MIEVGKEEGVLSDEERRMLHRIFEFGDTKVCDVMVTRNKIVAVNININSEELLNMFVEEGHARLPVYSGTIDNIVGVIYARDLLYILRDKGLFLLQDLIHKVYYVSETRETAAKKCIVLDCDGVLWDGIVGEDGVDGIRITSAHLEFQRKVKELQARGFILAINSSNNMRDVEEVFEKRPEMILKKDDFVVMKANWQGKEVNMREIAQALNIGLDSFVFFDDAWERAGSGDWVEVLRRRHPDGRSAAELAYFPSLRSSVLYGGSIMPNVFTDDTWIWTGRRWYQLNLDPHPTGHCGGFVFDPVLRGMLLFVGCAAPGVFDNETWTLH